MFDNPLYCITHNTKVAMMGRRRYLSTPLVRICTYCGSLRETRSCSSVGKTTRHTLRDQGGLRGRERKKKWSCMSGLFVSHTFTSPQTQRLVYTISNLKMSHGQFVCVCVCVCVCVWEPNFIVDMSSYTCGHG